MPNIINKVIYGGNTLIDLTADTVVASGLQSGLTAHDKSGAVITGTNTYDADTSDADASQAEILLNKTAYVNGVKLTGTMPNRGAVTGTISTKAGTYTIQNGYHDGSGRVSISSTEQAKIIAGNIKAGIQILGVTGTYSGEEYRFNLRQLHQAQHNRRFSRILVTIICHRLLSTQFHILRRLILQVAILLR